MNHLKRVGVKLIVGFGAIFFLFAFIFAVQNTVITFNSIALASLIIGLCVAAVLFLAFLVNSTWMTRNRFLVLLILLTVGLRVAWIHYIDTPPVSDFLDIHSAALSAAKGDFTFGQSEYFTRWVYQLGFTLYEAVIIKLFGEPIWILMLFNILFSTGTTVIIFFGASKLFNEFCGKMASLLYAIYVPHIIMCSVLTNQHLSTLLFTLACYLIIRNEKEYSVWSGIAIGACLGLGNLIRPMGSFFLLGFAMYFILLKWSPILNKNTFPLIKMGVSTLLVYILLTQAASYSLIASGVTSFPLATREPYWKFMVGLNPTTNGDWSQEDTDYVTQFELGEKRNQAELALLKKRLENKAQVLQLMGRKFISMWGSEDTSPNWSLWGMERWDLFRLLMKGERVLYVIIMGFGFVSMLYLFKRTDNLSAMWFIVLLLGYAALHEMIEIQTRYRFDILPFVFILQSFGIYGILRNKLAPVLKNGS